MASECLGGSPGSFIRVAWQNHIPWGHNQQLPHPVLPTTPIAQSPDFGHFDLQPNDVTGATWYDTVPGRDNAYAHDIFEHTQNGIGDGGGVGTGGKSSGRYFLPGQVKPVVEAVDDDASFLQLYHPNVHDLPIFCEHPAESGVYDNPGEYQPTWTNSCTAPTTLPFNWASGRDNESQIETPWPASETLLNDSANVTYDEIRFPEFQYGAYGIFKPPTCEDHFANTPNPLKPIHQGYIRPSYPCIAQSSYHQQLPEGLDSAHESPSPSSPAPPSEPDLPPYRETPVTKADIYSPRWIRGTGTAREGRCPHCEKWLTLKNSAYWYHQTYTHHISAITGRFFDEPVERREVPELLQRSKGSRGRGEDGERERGAREGLCGSCGAWMRLGSGRRRNAEGMGWFRHAYKCQIQQQTDKSHVRRASVKSRNSSPKKLGG